MKTVINIGTAVDTQAFYTQLVRADRPEEVLTNPVLVEAGHEHLVEMPEEGQALVITAGPKVIVPMSMRFPNSTPQPAPARVETVVPAKPRKK